MISASVLQWATVLGFGALLSKLVDIAWAGIKEARAARRIPMDELEIARRSRLVWMDYASTCKSIAIQNGVDANKIPPLPNDPMVRLPAAVTETPAV